MQNYIDGISKEGEARSSFDPWWMFNKRTDVHLLESLNAKARQIEDDMQTFWSDAKMYNRHFEEDPGYYSKHNKRNRIAKSWNVLRIACDEHYNRIVKIRPKISFLTKGGKIKINNLAQKIDDYLLNLFIFKKVYQKQAFAYKDACIANLGC